MTAKNDFDACHFEHSRENPVLRPGANVLGLGVLSLVSMLRVEGATAYCGDGVQNGEEACDDGNRMAEACVIACQVCGITLIALTVVTTRSVRKIVMMEILIGSLPLWSNFVEAGAAAFCGDEVVNGQRVVMMATGLRLRRTRLSDECALMAGETS